jgi:hypothetical protein
MSLTGRRRTQRARVTADAAHLVVHLAPAAHGRVGMTLVISEGRLVAECRHGCVGIRGVGPGLRLRMGTGRGQQRGQRCDCGDKNDNCKLHENSPQLLKSARTCNEGTHDARWALRVKTGYRLGRRDFSAKRSSSEG